MRCTNCGLPLSPARTLTNCPRCGAPLNAGQGVQQSPFEAGGWGGSMGGVPQENPWGQAGPSAAPNPFAQQGMQNPTGMGQARMAGSGTPPRPEFRESSFPPRRPYAPQNSPKKSRNLFMIAGLCVIFGALLLVLVLALGSGILGNNSSTTNNTNPTKSADAQPTTAPTTASTNETTTPTVGATPEATGTVYPAQQYIDGAQMSMGVDKQ
ncbi:MAG TPA: hypothetical protein VFN35_34280, partial [Ktedonobacteraceae bacterium]|nr:hypothetical protein [Ktedonobacteraceae bacterium]